MKTIICDMSGIASIKGKNNELLLTTLQSLRNLQYTFCTGKGFLGACNTIKNNKLSLPIICENGALIIDESGNIVFSDIMDYVKIKELINYLHENTNYEFIACCNLKTNKYKFLYNKNMIKEELNPTIFFNEQSFYDKESFLETIKDIDVIRIIYRGNEIQPDILNVISNNFEISSSEREYYNFCNIGINKKSGIKKLIGLYNLKDDDIILIGNDYNDIEMFKYNCFLKIAVGDDCPKELTELSDISISLDKLPNLLVELDKKE